MQATVIIKDVFNITGIGAITTVELKQGILKKGMKLNVKERVMTVKTMEQNHKQLEEAKSGTIGVLLQNADHKILKELKGSTVTFTAEGNIRTQIPLKSRPNHPKGAFSFLTNLFKK